jgi:hypothetical protein
MSVKLISLWTAIVLGLTLAGCAKPRQDGTDWAGVSREVGRVLNQR